MYLTFATTIRTNMKRKEFLFIKPFSEKGSTSALHAFSCLYFSTMLFSFFTYMLVLSRNYQGVFELLALCTAMSCAGVIESCSISSNVRGGRYKDRKDSEVYREEQRDGIDISDRVKWDIGRFLASFGGIVGGVAAGSVCGDVLNLHFHARVPLWKIVTIFVSSVDYTICRCAAYFYYFRATRFLKNTYSELKLVSFQPAKDILLSTLKIIMYIAIVTTLIMMLNYISKTIVKEYIVDNALNLIQDAS